jgi:serine/threonine protein kinase
VNKNFFEFLYIIGRGGNGKVWKVKLKKTNEYFALKEMSKLKIIDRRSEISIMSEKTLLSKLNNPFIVNMYFTFQDFSNLYLVMDLLTGGDLRYHIAKRRKFTEKETKFFIANMLLALEYIHSKNIIHRDIKPENLVLELNGYLRITDFGVAKINEKDNSSETSGTPGYMAPEVILVQNHSFPSDFFALGVIGFEFMLGYRPYLGGSRKEIKELIIYKQAKLEEDDIPYSWSLEAGDFINKLLKRKPSQRLGYHGVKEIKNHLWMRDINWNLLKKKEITAPFIPNPNRENFDKAYCEKVEGIGETTIERYQEYVESELFLEAFEGYTYINLDYLNSKIHRNKKKEENIENKKEEINENKEENIKVNIVNENNNEVNKENENKNKNNEGKKENKEKERNEEVIENKEIIEVKKKEENENNDDKKTIIVDSSRVKKNYSINFNKNQRKQKSVSQGKILNNSSHNKLKINIYKKDQNINANIKPINYIYKKQTIDNENKKEVLKRMSANDNIKANKNYSSNIEDMVNDKKENDNKLKYDKEMLRRRALKISSKMKEMKKKNDSNTNSNLNNKKNNSKRLAMNKSSSMKMLNSMKKEYLNNNYVNNFIKKIIVKEKKVRIQKERKHL